MLIDRLQDTNATILETLYSQSSVITPIYISDTKAYLSSLSLAIDSQSKTKRSILRLHLQYLVSSFWSSVEPSIQDEVFHQVLFPFLLFSKPRQKTAEVVWDLLDEHILKPSEDCSIEWLKGCITFVKTQTPEAGDFSEAMNEINNNVAEKIAYNILNSPRSSKHIDTLIKKLQDSRSHVKLLGYLIATALIKKSSEIIQIETAQKLMDAMCLKEISGIDDQSQEHLALLSENNRSLSKYIISKPNSQTTLNWLQIVLIATILRIPKPSGIALDWLAESAQAHSYIRLTRSLYNLANVSKSVPVLATTLLEILFSTLQSDALAFLAGIWTAGSNDSQSFASLALLHAAAFLEAHILEDDGIDFQTILPALLVALHNSDSSISHGAIECVSRIRLISEHNLVSVYKFDKIYGKNKDALQYLNREDLKRYLSAIVEHRDHFKNDPSYLKILHEQHLSRNKADKKRDTDYKHRVVCYILSHINALSSETAQNSLLKSISTVTDKAKSEMLLSTIQLAVEKASLVDASPTPSSTLEELTSRLLSCYDAVSAVHLNESDVAWDVFVKVTTTYFRADTLLSFQEALAHGIEAGLFTSLNQQRKTALCDILLEVGSQNQSGLSLARRVLSTILVDVPLIIRLLESYSPSGPTSSPRVSKRAKTTESPEDTLPRLSLLAEILGSGSLPGSLDLVSHLLDTLSKIIQTLPQVQPDVSYIEQLLMSAIESSASKITEVPNISPSVIRLDVLVEVIRVSNNPQTFHQALLLISNLARLAPESVLYNVMPIFTFMGSNVFHRDDSYSFKVVQQTINAIVPVMASSLKKAHASSLDLFLKSKEFLCVFSDAANHIPRHRRNNFFAHLIDALGPRDFLAPMCMLLTEKTANRVVRQTSDEIQNSLTLPISLLQHSSYSLQLHTATQILEESKRMIEHIINPDSTHPIFLEATVNGDHSISSSTILRRRAQALIIFIGYSLKPMNFQASEIEDTLSISSVIAQLITLATLHDGTMKETNLQEVSEAARSTLGKLLNGMSVVDFIEAVKIMLQSSDAKVQSGALELLAKRLPDVSDKTRTAISSSITKILLSIKEISSVQKDSSTLTYALQAIKSISSTLSPGEEGALTDVVPFVLSVSKEKSLALPALGALSSMSIKLGPRIIPFFRSIISQCVSLLRGSNLELFDEALSVLHGLLVTIPTFWGSNEITQVIFLHIDQASLASKLPSSASSSLMKALSKRTLSNVLISTLVEIWQSLKSSTNLSKTSAYFDVYARAVQYANRPTVMEYLRVSFKNFLEAFDVVKVDVEAEFRVISAFKELVVKLNETAFKPLFRRLHDWAFVEKIDDISRKVTFGHLYIALLDFFKGLMVPYISFLLQPYSDTLTAFTNSSIRDFDLWSTILETLTKALSFDDGGYWRDDKLRQIAKPLTDQIDVCVRLKFTDGNGQAILQDCFNALIEFATDDNLLKSINLSILMHTRSEDARVRILALSCSEAIWRTNGGGKLLGFVSETATFIAECSEDENDLVIKECFKLKDTVENVAGKIDGL